MRATCQLARGHRSSARFSFQDARCSGASSASNARPYGSSDEARPASRSPIAAAASSAETKHSYIPSPETGSISPAASPTSNARSPATLVPGRRSGQPVSSHILELRGNETVGRADAREMLPQPRPLLRPRPHADVHVVTLREHPAVTAGNVGELDDGAMPVAIDPQLTVGHVALERDPVDDRTAERQRLRSLSVRPVRSDDHVGRNPLTGHRDSTVVRDLHAFAYLGARGTSSIQQECVEPTPLRHPDHRRTRPAHHRIAIAEPELDDVDAFLDDGRRIDRAAEKGTCRQPAAARLVARKTCAVGNEHTQTRRCEPMRRRGPGGPRTDHQHVETLHDVRLQCAAPGVCPSGQRERAVNPSAQPTEVRILPPPLTQDCSKFSPKALIAPRRERNSCSAPPTRLR